MRSLPLSPLKEMRQQRRWGSEKTTTITTTNLQFQNGRFHYSKKTLPFFTQIPRPRTLAKRDCSLSPVCFGFQRSPILPRSKILVWDRNLFTQRATSGRTQQQQQNCLSQQQQNISGERKARQMQAERSLSRKTIRVCSNEAASKAQAKKTEGCRQAGRQASNPVRTKP